MPKYYRKTFKVGLIFLVIWAVVSVAFARGAEPEFDDLLNAKTLKCFFTLGINVDWKNAILNHKISKSKMEFSFSAIDHKKNNSTMIGNGGASNVSVIANAKGLTFFELTATGNRNFTTVFHYYNETLFGFVAVHSRHIDMFGTPIPSQYYGVCKVWDF